MRETMILVCRLAILGIVGILLAAACVVPPAADAPTPGGAGTLETDPANSEPEDRTSPGFTDDAVLFGQSAAFSGPAREQGIGMRLGIEAAFHEANQAGGVHGRQLRLTALNDSYEIDFAFSNTQQLINQHQVFALIGSVGTPTSRAAYPLAQAADIPFLAPFTGAEFLRDPDLDNVINLRASYYQETEAMVARLTEDLGFTRIAVLYQDDSFGNNGLEGVQRALQSRQLEPVVAWHYPRNTNAVRAAALRISEAEPEAVIMVGSYSPVARAVDIIRREIDPVFMAVSFVGSNALAEQLGSNGAGIYVTQVVPLPYDAEIPLVSRYHDALADFDPDAEPGFVSLEGYLAGRLAIEGLEYCGRNLSRRCFLNALHNREVVNIDGIELRYGPNDNQGSDNVFLTVIDGEGQYRQVETVSIP